MGIRNKLLLCLLAVILPLAAVGAFATRLVDMQTAERTIAALANTQRLEAARLEQTLRNYASDARTLASDPTLRSIVSALPTYQIPDAPTSIVKIENPEEVTQSSESVESSVIDYNAELPLQRFVLDLQRRSGLLGPSIVDMRIVNLEGRNVGQTDGFTWTPTDGKLIGRSMRSVKTLFGDAFINANSRERLGLVSPIRGKAGEIVGALVIESRLKPIINLISEHENMGNSVEAHIAQPTQNGDAQFITPLRFDRKSAFNKVVPAERGLPINKALNSPDSQVIRALDYRGVESFLAFQTIADTGWGLVIKIDTSESFAPVAKLRNWLRLATVASICFVALIYLFFLVPVARRLKRAAMAAREILDGNLSARLLDNNKDEIAELAGSINSLARDLAADQRMRCEVEARLRHQAIHDELTGLLNRKHANNVIHQLSERSDQEHSVMFLDLNGFKDVNDLYGHAAGDEVLKCLADRLAKLIPQGSTLARWGGDEFVVILPDTSAQKASEFSLTLNTAFDDPAISTEGCHTISCSIGLATSSKHKSLEQALLEADSSMYEQKQHQRTRRSTDGMATLGVDRALLENRMEIWFQPMVRMERPGSYVLFGADTSMRMRNNLGGYVLPNEFLPQLKSNSVLRKLDNRTVDLALSTLSRWNLAGIVDDQFRLSLRLSTQTLNDEAFPTFLENRLLNADVRPGQIQLVLPFEPGQLSDSVLLKLRNMGVHLALIGLHSEPNLMRHVTTTQPSTAIIGNPCLKNSQGLTHLVDICQKLEVGVMANHVENREQLAQLHQLGVTQFQGGLFEQSVSAVDFVSRWGQTRLTRLGSVMTQTPVLRLVG